MRHILAWGRELPLRRRSFDGAVCALALFLSGCVLHRTRAYPWSTAVLVHPRIPPPAAAAGDTEPPPDLQPVIPEPSLRLVMMHGGTPRPQPVGASDANGAGRASRPTPELAPRLSSEEMASAQQETRASLAIAEQNLGVAKRRSLAPTQAELAAKIRNFIDQAGEAVRAGDWVGARTLAQKAQALSEDLVRLL